MSASDLVRRFEECRLSAYVDIGGLPTIGWGHAGKDVYPGLVWTQAQADEALGHDLIQATALLTLYSPGLPDGARAALTDFVFNVGIGHYRTSTLCRLVNARAWAWVPSELLKWDHVNGVEVPGLRRRRQAEANLIVWAKGT
jgi:lysozyme